MSEEENGNRGCAKGCGLLILIYIVMCLFSVICYCFMDTPKEAVAEASFEDIMRIEFMGTPEPRMKKGLRYWKKNGVNIDEELAEAMDNHPQIKSFNLGEDYTYSAINVYVEAPKEDLQICIDFQVTSKGFFPPKITRVHVSVISDTSFNLIEM